MPKISLILHNIRSGYNVGAITRTAECFAIENIYATGYTPYTLSNVVKDPPHIVQKMKSSIHKTALGTEQTLPVVHVADINQLIKQHKENGYTVAALEQSDSSKAIFDYSNTKPLLVILGEEVNGVPENVLKYVDLVLEIPMLGKKESFNVSVATGIALYELRRVELIEQSR